MTPAQKLLVLLLAMAIACFSTLKVDAWRYGKQIADRDIAQALAIARAVSEAREEDQRRQSAVNKAGSDAREQNKAADVDGSIAATAGDRLYVEASKFAAASCSDPGSAQRGASATRAAMVLSDLLQRADKRAGELAAAYDHSRIAGLTCERSYDGLRPGSK
ncbi:DUF2514 domain-containing protein [Pseudomonas sp. B22129]|uniref:DUF2514 domain-containing protein n=1 Tax=Pseudomonas sp. B22129 TaxID=3235111 RepID=UPI0037848C17